MASVDLRILGQIYELRGDEPEEHLAQVASLVQRRVEALIRRGNGLSVQKAAILAACDFASQALKGKTQALDYQSDLISRAGQILEKIESELKPTL